MIVCLAARCEIRDWQLPQYGTDTADGNLREDPQG